MNRFLGTCLRGVLLGRVSRTALWALWLWLVSIPLAAGPTAPFGLELQFPDTRWGQSIFVLGDIPELGGGRMERAVKLEPTEYPVWKLAMGLPPRTAFSYRFVLRDDAPEKLSDPANGQYVSPSALRARTGDAPPAAPPAWPPSPARPASPSRLVTHEGLACETLGNSRSVRVYLPPGYDDSSTLRYPVLYMHDGQNLFRPGGPFGCWDVEMTLDRMILAGELPPLVCVGIDNTPARMIEYVPPYSAIDGQAGVADRYCQFLVEQVAPFVEARYRVSRDRRQRIVGGSSLGGLVSAYLGWHHPAFASRLLCLSPSFQLGEILAHFENQPARDVTFYLDSGDQGRSHDGLAATFHARDALLKGDKYRLGENLFHRIAYGHGHNEPAWRARFGQALRTVLGR
ncbi:MAG: hypothetical protein HY816_00525 [Candidatus Wallbacteria bacterium]|nr:hypothetical protein [Candidatus Wallbacteria bacterium]